MSDLKPCPFCGSKDPDAEKYKGSVTGQEGRVHCYCCGADGPTIPYAPDDKFWTWNSRVTEPDFARALIDTTAERDALRERVARLEAALTLYSCEDGCNDCPEHERDRVSCGWTAFAALQKDTPND